MTKLRKFIMKCGFVFFYWQKFSKLCVHRLFTNRVCLILTESFRSTFPWGNGYFLTLIYDQNITFPTTAKLLLKLILEFGPLIKIWTMRFESKHRFLKRTIRNLLNCINVVKSLKNTKFFKVWYDWELTVDLS